MGDRTNPMKFGPEWLRNLSREPSGTGGSSAQSNTPATRPVSSTASASSSTSASAKAQFAKYRYGREEMLALYDRQAAEAPVQLKSIEVLYQSRGKSPYALNSNFEEDTRDSGGIRNNPQAGAMSADRFGPGRGRGFNPSTRGSNVVEGRGKTRTFARPTSSGTDTFRAASWHNGAQRSYLGAPDDDPNSSRGLWNNGNGANPPGIRASSEQVDWANKMAYRKPRPNHTNWRQQHNRDEGEEWRSDGARRGPDKWDREWPERGPQEKGYSANRRHWTADGEELPEWAVELSLACGGTFDASGVFHGYNNDDNVTRPQDSPHAVARSQTQGSIPQQFPKRRFDALEVKFKKPMEESVTDESGNQPSVTNERDNPNSGQLREIPNAENVRKVSQEEPEKDCTEYQEEAAALPPQCYSAKQAFLKYKAMEAAQRQAMQHGSEESEPKSEQGTNKSVMMTSNNNNLRQQHQNVDAPSNKLNMSRFQNILDSRKKMESEFQENKQTETNLVGDLLDRHLTEDLQVQFVNTTTQSAGSVNAITNQSSSSGLQMRVNNPLMTPGMSMNQPQASSSQAQPTPETNMVQPIGISNLALNASLGLPIGTGSNMNMSMTSMPTPHIQNPGVPSSNLQGLGTGNMQNMQIGGMPSRMQVPGLPVTSFQTAMPSNNMPGLQPNMQPNMQPNNMNNINVQATSGMPGYQANSLFMAAPNNMQNPAEMGNQGQQNMYMMHGHGLQQSASQGSFTPASLYDNMMQPPPGVPQPNIPLADLWYYEDPNKTIQGPFTSKEMYGWYHAGFFTPDLMVRRACETTLMPLANYGYMPFISAEAIPPQFNPIRARFDMQEQENVMNARRADLNLNVETLWRMMENSADDMMWSRHPGQKIDPEELKTVVNNLSQYFWEQPTGSTKSMLPETIKDMKTEEEILAQIRASQSESAAQNLTFICDAAVSPEEAFTAGTNIAPNLEELQKLIGSDVHRNTTPSAPEPPTATAPRTQDAPDKADPVPEESAKQQTCKDAEAKPSKQQAKVEEKPKVKEAPPKAKAKKVKDEKKEELAESKKEEKKLLEKRSDQPSPPKNKRDEKANKKELEKEKKEWLKDGFTIVKGAEKKDSKKKEKEEARAAEEVEKKRKEEEKRALEAEKNKAPEPVTRRQQLEQGQRQSQLLEQMSRKAPWSGQSSQTGRDGLALSDIQRLEREKKLEQMKEQQQMMHVIAQQQAAAAQREQQETQAGHLGWAKKKPTNAAPGQTLAEIQAEARKQAAAMVVAAAVAARDEKQPTPPPPLSITPWGSTNGAGFWDCPLSTRSGAGDQPPASSTSRTSELKSKKKVTVVAPPKKEPAPSKKEVSPSADFDNWCIQVLSNWKDAANIDIPTFVAFLRDIESPYEVKDYVKCYLGDTKEANDFARQFLERRSRMLRVGMVTPSDDLCSPAAAITPRTNSGSDYTELKSKGNKKTKKNKMLKVDARILGFSVTASEDRINVGDIDTA